MAESPSFVSNVLISAIGLLDAVPDFIRALLSGLLLALFLRFFETRIASREWQLGQSFRKTALVLLLLVPLLVWLFPAGRMVVFVEELTQREPSMAWLWKGVVSAWALGVAVSLLRLGVAGYRAMRLGRSLPIMDDEPLAARLAHWQRRLGLRGNVVLVRGPDGPRLPGGGGRLELPPDFPRWPSAERDVLLIQALCHLKRHHLRWHRVAAVVSCVYWPVTWVQRLGANLWRDLEQATAALAQSCFADGLGYGRALQQLRKRLDLGGVASRLDTPAKPTSTSLSRYASAIAALRDPADAPPWPATALLADRAAGTAVVWTDPYDRVVLLSLQAAFLAFLLTGVTLRERLPELEADYQLPFELLWKEQLHRNRELVERFGG